MKILQICSYMYPHIGGIEQVARDCANALKNDCEQKIICFNHEKGNLIDEVDGISVIRAGCFAKIASQSLSVSFGKLLKKTLKNFKPDVIIFHYPNPFAAHYLLKHIKKYPNIKLILYWHLDITKQKLLGKFFKGQTKRLIRRAAKIFATSPNYIDGSFYLSENKDKCEVLSCCVAQERIKISDKEIALANAIREENKGKTICLAMGRHVPYKGLEYLVKASAFLSGEYRIYIGGQGPLTNSLIALAQNDKKITFLGKVSLELLKAYIQACDIFCFPSITKNEAFGIALAEAMGCGKPAVTFTIKGSGVNYVSLNGVTGIEVENSNAEKYAEAIKELALNKELRVQYGANAQKRVEELFTEEVFQRKLKSVIASLFGNAK